MPVNSSGSPRERTFRWDDPRLSAAAAPTMSGLAFLDAIRSGELPAPPVAHALDFTLTEVEPGRAVFEMVPAEFHYNPIGMVHGGVAATLMDSAMGCAVQSQLPEGSGYTTLEMKVNLFLPITVDTGRVRCEATVLRAGRSTAAAEARLSDAEGRLLAYASSTCMILRREG